MSTSNVYAAQVTTLSDAIADQANGNKRLAAAVRNIAADFTTKPAELTELLTVLRSQVFSRRDKAVQSLKSQKDFSGADVLGKAYINALSYAVKCAAEVIDFKIVWNIKAKQYDLTDKPAAGEKAQQTAVGKDANSASQSAALISAAEAAPVLVASDRHGHLMGILSNLLTAGYTLTEVESAWHGMAAQVAQGEKAAEVAASAQNPLAPAILASKPGVKAKPAQKKRAA